MGSVILELGAFLQLAYGSMQISNFFRIYSVKRIAGDILSNARLDYETLGGGRIIFHSISSNENLAVSEILKQFLRLIHLKG
ncbi:hypothetical protein [Azospirillum brasilense]|uniref:hypothetical protein n=1 Tax=Azospirillum brasilense TaxID=192 RepID=UPI0010C05B4B|nr:hypothetical protein [Azospirillum brasilense]